MSPRRRPVVLDGGLARLMGGTLPVNGEPPRVVPAYRMAYVVVDPPALWLQAGDRLTVLGRRDALTNWEGWRVWHERPGVRHRHGSGHGTLPVTALSEWLQRGSITTAR